MKSLSEIRNIVAAYDRASLEDPAKLLAKGDRVVMERKEDGRIEPTRQNADLPEKLAQRNIRGMFGTNFSFPTKAEFLAALRADGAVGRLMADRLALPTEKPLEDREFVMKGLQEYDRMVGLFGRNTSVVRKSDLASVFPKAHVGRFNDAMKSAYDRILELADAVGQAEQNLKTALAPTEVSLLSSEGRSFRRTYDAAGKRALDTLADANSDLACALREFRNDCGRGLLVGGTLTEEDVNLLEGSLSSWDDFADRAESRAIALGNLSAELDEITTAVKAACDRGGFGNDKVMSMVETLNGEVKIVPDKVQGFMAKIDAYEKAEMRLSDLLNGGSLGTGEDQVETKKRLATVLKDLVSSVGKLRQQLDKDWGFSPLVGSDKETLWEIRDNVRAMNAVTGLRARLAALEVRLGSLTVFGAPSVKLGAGEALKRFCAEVLSMKRFNEKDVKDRLPKDQLDCIRGLYNTVQSMENGRYPLRADRERAMAWAEKLECSLKKSVSIETAPLDFVKFMDGLSGFKKFLDRLPKDDAQLVRDAYDGRIDLENMVQLKVQGVVDDMILEDDLLAEGTDGKLQSSEAIGAGKFNEVRERKYTNMVEGSKVTYVTKPVETANDGFKTATAARHIYGDLVRHPAPGRRTPNAVANNICAHKGAKALGCGHVIVRSGVAFLKEEKDKQGKYVLAMEKAPGATLSVVRRGKGQEVTVVTPVPVAQLQGQDKLPFQDALDLLDDAGRAKAEDEMMGLCNDLEWADFLSGQADRHMKNVLFGAELHVRPDDSNSFTCELRGMTLKGIDNDISFPVNDFRPLGADATQGAWKKARQKGVNSARLPVFVTSAMLRRLEDFSKNHEAFLKEVGADLLLEEQRNALLDRLEAMLKHARNLANAGLVVHDGTDKDPGLTLSDLREKIRGKIAEIAGKLDESVRVEEDEARHDLLRDWKKAHGDEVRNGLVTKEREMEIMRNFSGKDVDQKQRELKTWSVKACMPIFAQFMKLNEPGMEPYPVRKSAVDVDSAN